MSKGDKIPGRFSDGKHAGFETQLEGQKMQVTTKITNNIFLGCRLLEVAARTGEWKIGHFVECIASKSPL